MYANINATDDEVEYASKRSFADEFIKKLPNKYDTLIGENGVRLSGGEKQRTAIARALCNDPDIILADEPSGNLDHHTSQEIYDLLHLCVKKKNKALVVVTHDLALAKSCDSNYQLRDRQLHLNANLKSP